MKFNISNSATGQQKLIEVDDEKKIRAFYGQRMGETVEGHHLGDEYKGYTFKITGGNDKQGFTMKHGVFTQGRVRLLLKAGYSCYRPRKDGEKKRKSVRGCICGPDLAVIALTITEKGENDVPGLTDEERPRRLGPKRANAIRKMFGLDKEDDVRKFVVKRKVEKGDKTFIKSPRIQRLITERRIRRKKSLKKIKKDRFEASKQAKEKYEKVLSTYIKEKKAKITAEKKVEAAEAAAKTKGSTKA
jgi:small subunit ribosomal protein S6e